MLNLAMLSLLTPEIFVAAMASVVLISSVIYEDRTVFLPYYLSISTMIAVFLLTLGQYPALATQTFNKTYMIDNLSITLKLILYILITCIFLYSKVYIKTRDFMHGEFFALSLFSLLGMMILTSTADFLTMFLGLELFVLPLYTMIVMVKKQPKYAEAAIKYFIIGSLGAGLLLYGISLVYGAAGSFAFTAVAQLGDTQYILKLGMILVLVGIALEFGAVPFHMWLPDVYEGSPTPVTMLIGTLPKIAIFAIAYRILSIAFPDVGLHWQQIFLALALLSVVVGNVAAIAQTNIKRLLAYSTIGHIGFILLGLFVAPEQGYLAPLFYAVVYALMALAAFALILRLTAEGFEAEQIADFKGLSTTHPWLAFLMLLIMFSLAGVPPLLGFYAKFLILQALVNAGFSVVAVVALLFSVVAAYYYLRVVKVMYFDFPDAAARPSAEYSMGTAGRVIVWFNAMLLLVLGLAPASLLKFCLDAFR